MARKQLSFPFFKEEDRGTDGAQVNHNRENFYDFHSEDVTYASHNFHPFPAKFPPQLPKHFIETLTKPGDIVLDPMLGSGTTILEAILMGRKAIGLDIDPLAVLIANVKTTSVDPIIALNCSKEIVKKAKDAYNDDKSYLSNILETRWDNATKDFIDYWFDKDTQLGLIALLLEIENLKDEKLKNFLRLAFSAIIITKTGGVSLALDLAHTRPHRAKLIYKQNGEILEGAEYLKYPVKNLSYATKRLRSPFIEFEKKVEVNLGGLLNCGNRPTVKVSFGNAENLPINQESVDLIVTSPPYASNAIDYMRAHKFSLVWFGYPVSYLGKKRSTYIGGELIKDITFEDLPVFTSQIVDGIFENNQKKGFVLRRYYSEMTRVLREMHKSPQAWKIHSSCCRQFYPGRAIH